MKEKVQKIIILIAGIVLNIVGRFIADNCNLPIWFDAVGTFITVYYLGVWGGAVAAFLNSFIFGGCSVATVAYALVNVATAVMMYLLIKRGFLSSLLRVIISGFWLGIVCTVAITPLNLLFQEGYSGNIWGDTLVDMLRWHDVPGILSALAGEAVVGIVNMQVCVLVTYLVLLGVDRLKRAKGRSTQTMAFLLALGMIEVVLIQPLTVQASNLDSDNFVAKIYNNTNGIVSSEANTICETNDGYIWIGSYAGLTRYDGIEFEFIRESRLVNVVEMMADSRGRLWIGTNDAGIARYEKGTYTYFTDKEGLPSNSVRCFAEDSAGNVYVGTSDRICKFHTDDTIEILSQDITFAKSMAVYKDMLIVMDNNGGLYALDGERKLKVADGAMQGLFCYCLAATSEGLMVGTETGELFVFDVSDKGLEIQKQIHVSANEISAVFEDSDKRIWIATESGLGYFDPIGNYHKMYYNGFDSAVACFHEDYQGNIWIASTRYGVMKLSESSFINLFDKAGIKQEVVNAVTYYKGDYYCGTDDGLITLDGRNYRSKKNKLTELLSGYRVRSFFVDSEERLWICTYNGLVCYDSDGGVRSYSIESDGATSNRFRCITELADGTIVAGTADGINFIKGGRLEGTLTAQDGLANTQILSVVEGRDKTVWAGSDGSGIYIISDGKLVKNYTVEDGLSSNVILRIIPHEDGCLVVTSNGLCHVDLDGVIRKLTKFPYFNNYDIIPSGETAYISCSAGLYETELSELCADSGNRFRLYGANEGLLSGLTANSWNYISDEGELYLCSNNGVIVFDSSSRNAAASMKCGVVSVECDGTEMKVTDSGSFTVPSNAKNISIYASVRNYTFADVKVRFYIPELDDKPKIYGWDEVEPIRIFKPDMSKYHIYLQVFDSSGENVLQETMYTLTKEPQMWETPIYKFYLFVVCLEIFLVTIISIVSMILFVVRKNELEKLQLELEKKVDEQTGELRIQQKTIKELFIQTVTALSEAVDAKDRYTSGHSKRVAEYARMIAIRLGKSKEEQEEIYRAGLLHDVGKIRIPVEIINKAGKLTDEEYDIIKIHPVTGYHILRGISGSNLIDIGAKYHHERYDGKGYPNGLEGEKIPEVARILGVADAYDAMTSNRSYRKALPQEVVRAEIEKGRGAQFDPAFADIMLQMIDEDKDYTMKQGDSLHRKVLVVDDTAMNRNLIAHVMQDEPMYEIVAVGSGKEALEMLEQQAFDLILLDVMMPEMDGLETLRLIREKYQTPVVLLTGDKNMDNFAEFEKLGCDDYITKPFLPLLIREVVHNMTERTNLE